VESDFDDGAGLADGIWARGGRVTAGEQTHTLRYSDRAGHFSLSSKVLLLLLGGSKSTLCGRAAWLDTFLSPQKCFRSTSLVDETANKTNERGRSRLPPQTIVAGFLSLIITDHRVFFFFFFFSRRVNRHQQARPTPGPQIERGTTNTASERVSERPKSNQKKAADAAEETVRVQTASPSSRQRGVKGDSVCRVIISNVLRSSSHSSSDRQPVERHRSGRPRLALASIA
jgi:hypothetical protein